MEAMTTENQQNPARVEKRPGLKPGFKRNLDALFRDQIRMAIETGIGVALDEQALNKAETFFALLDKKMVGRIAGDIEDYIFNHLASYAVSKLFGDSPNLVHVEIGTLFGGSLILNMEAIRLSEVDRAVIAIDPLDGYYRQDYALGSEVDIQTHLPVNIETVLKNISIMGFEGRPHAIWKLYSTDEEAHRRAKSLDIAFLFIDGDHGYAGIANDWAHFASRVVEGGFVLIDNYNDHSWPDVTRFVNQKILNCDSTWEPVFCLNRSILFRRTSRRNNLLPFIIGNLTGRGVDTSARLRTSNADFRQNVVALEKTLKEKQAQLDGLSARLVDLKSEVN
jgi:hypothetical protein